MTKRKNSPNLSALITLICFLLTQATPLTSQPHSPAHYLPQSKSNFISLPTTQKHPIFSYPVTPERAHKIVYEGVILNIPAGAVDKETIITIEKLTQVKPVNETMDNVTARAAGYRFGPHPFHFIKNITVTLPYLESVNYSETSLSDLKIWFYHETQKCWESLPVTKIDREKSFISGLTSHFTDMITGTLTLPDAPEAINFNPNSIKELESVDPGTGIPEIQGLMPGAMGGASFSLPLTIPPGRGRAYQQLWLNYNVNRLNSWMGRGFDLSVAEISTDTRFGLPEYKGKDSYMLEGNALVWEKDLGGGREEYLFRSEGSFQRIHRIRDSLDPRGPDYWSVTAKDGTIRYFGGYGANSGKDDTHVYTWHLQEKIDVHGNRVFYDYEKIANHLYLKNINWSGHGLNRGPYDVTFIRAQRDDVHTEGRGKYIDTLSELLGRVEISYEGEVFRSYDFNYISNMFGQSQLISYSENDSKGETFYTYRFEYQKAKKEGEGFTGFILDEWAAPQKPLSNNQSSALGYSLALTIGFQGWSFYWLGAKKEWLWQVSFQAGGGSSHSWQTSELIDLDGNGLPDMIYQEGNRLTGLCNEGTRFGGGLTFANFDAILNDSSQSHYTLGGSAGIGPATVSISYQDSNSYQGSALYDVDSDGFLDVVTSNSGSYLKNMNNPHSNSCYFEERDWEETGSDSQIYLPHQEMSPEEQENYQRSYYIETPVRRWKAYKPGKIHVSHSLGLTDQNQLSPDGVRVIMDYSQDNPDLLNIDSSVKTTSQKYLNVDKDQEFYFLLDPVKDITGLEREIVFKDNLQWSTSMDYESIAWFAGEPHKQAIFDIPLNDKSHLINAAEQGRFIPVFIPTDKFDALYYSDAFSDNRDKAVLQTLYLYNSLTNQFLLRENISHDRDALSLLRSCLYRLLPQIFTSKELRNLAFSSLKDDEVIWIENPYPDSESPDVMVLSYEKELSGDRSIYSQELFFLDRVYEEESLEGAYQDYYSNQEGSEVILFNESGQEIDHMSAVSQKTGLNSSKLSFHYQDTEYQYCLDWSTYPSRVASSVYHEKIYPAIMNNEEVRLFPHEKLTREFYLSLIEDLDDQRPLENLYQNEDDFYLLLSPENYPGSSYEQDYITLIKELDKVKTPLEDSVFYEWDMAPSDKSIIGLITLTPGEKKILMEKGDMTEEQFLTGGGLTFIDPHLGLSERISLTHKISQYRAYEELFPFYKEETDFFILDADDPDEETNNVISELFESLGLKSLSHMAVSYLYGENHWFTLLEKSEAKPQVSLPVNTLDSTLPTIEAYVSYKYFTLIQTNGETSFKATYPVHCFNSLNDYSLENRKGAYLADKGDGPLFELPSLWEDDIFLQPLKPYLGQIIEEDRRESSFSGGFRNWTYGFYSLYPEYDWDPERIGQDDFDESTYYSREEVEQRGAQVVKPPYFTAAEINENRWVGTVSDYSQSETKLINDRVELVYENKQFAPFLSANDIWHPMRKGGLTYYHSMAYVKPSDPGIGFDMTEFQHCRSTGMTYSGGISLGFAGVKGGYTDSLAAGVRTFRDINGDSYPDLLSMDEGGLTALFGGLSGFQGGRNYSGGFNVINETRNETITAGASIVPGGKLEDLIYSPQSVPIATSAITDYEGGKIGSAGVNGTETITQTQKDLIDINGDGLIDHICAQNGSDYDVRLNSSDRFISVPDWENTTEHNLGRHVTGSLGASLTGGIGIVGLSGGINGNVSLSDFQLLDINGDGLPDQVEKKSEENFFRVHFNQGSRFTEEVKIYCPDWNYDIDNFLAQMMNDMAKMTGIDINGMEVIPNLGDTIDLRAIQSAHPITTAFSPFSIHDTITSSSGTSLNLGAGFSISINYLLMVFSINPGINGTWAESRTSISLRDMNGDGAPEHLFKNPLAPSLLLRVNQLADVGIMTAINLPQGGRYELAYQRSPNTVQDPHSRLNLSSLIRKDGKTGSENDIHEYREEYRYDKGYYDRDEREFYGYQTIICQRADNSYTQTDYHNQQYHLKDRPIGQTIYDTEGAQISINNYSYDFHISPSGNSKFVYLEEERMTLTDPVTKNIMESLKKYDYDDYGNLTELLSEIEGEGESQNYLLKIAYDKNYTLWIMDKPISLEAYWGTEEIRDRLLRKRTAQYDSRGNLITLNQHYGINDDEVNTTCFTYYDFGNIESRTEPGGYKQNYAYGKHNQYLESLSDTLYNSHQTWDKRYAQVTSSTDINGHSITKRYDSCGRISEVRTPYDKGLLPALSYHYDTDHFPWRGISRNKISQDPNNLETLETIVTIDGLGRISQRARESVITQESQEKFRGWSCSGALWYDTLGRPIKEGQPQFQILDYALPLTQEEYPKPTPMKGETEKTYDNQGRLSYIIMPDGSLLTTDYAIDQLSQSVTKPYSGLSSFQSKITQTDALGNITEIGKNFRGQITGMVKKDNQEIVLAQMSYEYNPLGELLSTTDTEGNQVRFTYDLMGRTTRQESSDAGIEEFVYNKKGLLMNKRDSNLIARGKSINYEYDSHNRLIKVDYPFSEDILYQYGTDRDMNNLGRLVRAVNGQADTHWEYGKLGEMTAQTQSISHFIPNEPNEIARFEYITNYLGQKEEIIYPDKEVLSYHYDEGGQIISAIGHRLGQDFPYIEDIGYDEYGQRVYIKYNNENGTETCYEYNKDTRWLNHIETIKVTGNRTYQNINYNFDKIGNILSIQNQDTRHHSTEQNFKYDNLYQLMEAQGSYQLHRNDNMTTFTSNYTQTFTHDKIGNMTGRISSEQQNPNMGMTALDYSRSYQYYPEAPHRVEQIGNMYYRYDENGNTLEERLGGHSSLDSLSPADYTRLNDKTTMANQAWAWYRTNPESDSTYSRQYTWDEENRLKETRDPSHTTRYGYDHKGERVVKSSDLGETLYFDNLWTVTNRGTSGDLRRTKNIYIDKKRLVSKMNFDEGNLDYEKTHIFYYHTDHLGSNNVVTDFEGNVFEHLEYTPYGELWIDDQEIPAVEEIPYKFTSKEKDQETGFYYMSARYMNPLLAKWINPDPAGFTLNPPQSQNSLIESMNPYAYVSHNPLKYLDPTGLREEGVSDILNAHNQWLRRAHQQERKEYTYKELIQIAEKAQLMGKLYETGFLCDDFGEALFAAMGIDKTEYLPNGAESLVTTNMDTLSKNKTLQQNPVPGWNVFYKRMDNGKEGHFGFVYMADDGTHTFLHNGWSSDEIQKVNIYNRVGYNPDAFFRKNKNFNIQYLPLKGAIK